MHVSKISKAVLKLISMVLLLSATVFICAAILGFSGRTISYKSFAFLQNNIAVVAQENTAIDTYENKPVKTYTVNGIENYCDAQIVSNMPTICEFNIALAIYSECREFVYYPEYQETLDGSRICPEPSFEYKYPELETQTLSIDSAYLLSFLPQYVDLPSNPPFYEFSFFVPEKIVLYEYFAHKNPHLLNEDVVWMVNANLHLQFYWYVRTNHDENPLLINPSNRLPNGFKPTELVPVNSYSCRLLATPETVAAFEIMRNYANQNGFNLSATSAFRTATRQQQLWANRNFTDGVVARPYHSEHQTGRALDLLGPDGLLDYRGVTPLGTWVANNAYRFGFLLRYRADTTHITGFIHEPWHITYVGINISMYMNENNILSLEEFVGRNPGATLNFDPT